MDIIKKIIDFLMGVGVKESYSSLLNRRIRFTNFIALSGFFSTFLYTLIIAGMDHRFLDIAYISSTVGLLYLLPVVLNACGKINLSRFLLLNYSLMIVFMFIVIIGNHSGVSLFYPAMICYIFLTYSYEEKKMIVISTVVTGFHIVGYMIYFTVCTECVIVEVPERVIDYLYVALFPLANIIVYLYVYYFSRVNHNAEKKLLDKNLDMSSIMENIKEGIFILGPDLAIRRGYSKHLEKIFETQHCDQTDFFDLLFQESDLGQDLVSQIRSTLNVVMDNQLINFSCNRHIFPSEYRKKGKHDEKIIGIEWEPMLDSEKIVRKMLIIVRDLTDYHRIQEESERANIELDMTGQILNLDLVDFRYLIRNSIESLQRSQQNFMQTSGYYQDVAKTLHSVKGNLRLSKFSYAVDAVHELESYTQNIIDRKISSDRNRYLSEIDGVIQSIAAYENLYEKRLGSKLLARKSDEELADGSRKLSVRGAVEKINQFDSEMLQLTYKGDDPLLLTKRSFSILTDVLAHLSSNAIAHGIEDPDERKKLGKSLHGNFYVSGKKLNHETEITVGDDGRGIDLKALRERFIMDFPSADNTAISDQTLAEKIFEFNVSTSKEITVLAGRGIGLSSVKRDLESVGGRIQIKLLKEKSDSGFRPFLFKIFLPEG